MGRCKSQEEKTGKGGHVGGARESAKKEDVTATIEQEVAIRK